MIMRLWTVSLETIISAAWSHEIPPKKKTYSMKICAGGLQESTNSWGLGLGGFSSNVATKTALELQMLNQKRAATSETCGNYGTQGVTSPPQKKRPESMICQDVDLPWWILFLQPRGRNPIKFELPQKLGWCYRICIWKCSSPKIDRPIPDFIICMVSKPSNRDWSFPSL